LITGYGFPDFTDQACGQDVACAKLASQRPGEARRDANIGPVRQDSPHRFERTGTPHAGKNHADTSAAKFGLKTRPVTRYEPEIPPALPRREFRLSRECH
jgi:hypothetical protein